jgi:hypothetical protein
MSAPDFTVAQANDLAHYFLGPDWCAARLDGVLLPYSLKAYTLLGGVRQIIEGDSWREVFRAAGVQLPLRPQYVAQGARVMMGDRAICTAVSNTLAKRIAAALNNHTPDRRGI